MLRHALTGLCLFGLVACGAEFEKPSEIKTLRVLAVQKDKPYAAPGETINFVMHWHDGSPAAPRRVTRAWLPLCVNPLGDQYYGCYASFAGGDGGSGTPGGGSIPDGFQIPDMGDSASALVPANVISSRAAPRDPKQPPYGLSLQFFALCAGNLKVSFTEARVNGGFPLVCEDDAGVRLSADDFVVGYTSIYSFQDFGNLNPKILGLQFRGQDVTPDCIGAACTTTPITPPDCSDPENVRCIKTCKDNGKAQCDDHVFKPIIDPNSAERDDLATRISGQELKEQMWINYLVTRGGIENEVRLVNDAASGWNDAPETNYWSPSTPGVAVIWGAVHDNRGGVEVLRYTVMVTE